MSSPLDWQAELHDVTVPKWVAALAGGQVVRPVWRNEDGGITYRFGFGRAFMKVQRPSLDWNPDGEVARLTWVARYLPAPMVLASGSHGDLRWLLTSGLPGRSAIDPTWRRRPHLVVPTLGRALRRFHDTVPLESCPFDWSVEHRVAHFGLDPGLVDEAPPVNPVVCHGDACNPNFLLDDDGRLSGYVDLGGLGVADRWADLAPALQSLGWNYGPGWESTFLDAYGIDPDRAKQAFYTELWDGVTSTL